MSSAKRKRSDSDDVAGSSATSAASDQPPKVPMVKEGSIGKSKEIINIVSNEDDEEDDGNTMILFTSLLCTARLTPEKILLMCFFLRYDISSAN